MNLLEYQVNFPEKNKTLSALYCTSFICTAHLHRAVLELKVSRDKLEKYQKKLTVLIEKEVDAAKALLKDKKKERALLVLQRKKMKEQVWPHTRHTTHDTPSILSLEQMLAKAEDQMTNIQTMVDSVESAQLEAQIVKAMREGTDALKEIQQEFSVEYVEQLMDDTAEAVALAKEMGDLLAESLSPTDDADTMAELLAMEERILQEELDMPPVPDHTLPDPVKDPATAATEKAAEKAQEEEEEEPQRELAPA